MPIAFNKILIPVDFSLNTEIAIRKAAGLVGHDETSLHLLHVVKPGRQATHQFKLWAVEKEMEKLKELIKAKHAGLKVKTHVLKGRNVQRLILDCANMLKPDLIIIGNNLMAEDGFCVDYARHLDLAATTDASLEKRCLESIERVQRAKRELGA